MKEWTVGFDLNAYIGTGERVNQREDGISIVENGARFPLSIAARLAGI